MIRKGMWVVNDRGEIGIANAIGADGSVEFHKVEADGTTSIVTLEPIGTLVQARYREIPECRRGLSKQQFEALGYC